jgi:hypothetical protein
MLTFNSSGLLVPDGKIISTLTELEKEFVKNLPSDQRREIFKCYRKYCEELKEICKTDSLLQWINGSFVTKKDKPGDIDIVTFLDSETIKSLGNDLDNFKSPYSETVYNVDAYILETYPQSHKNIFFYQSDFAYWYDNFTKTRRTRGNRLAKGFLEITI